MMRNPTIKKSIPVPVSTTSIKRNNVGPTLRTSTVQKPLNPMPVTNTRTQAPSCLPKVATSGARTPVRAPAPAPQAKPSKPQAKPQPKPPANPPISHQPPRQIVSPIASKTATQRGSVKNGSPAKLVTLSCRYCDRSFADDRLAKHEEICAKVSKKHRKPYDAVKHRVLGTEAEIYVKPGKGKAGNRVQIKPSTSAAPSNSNWRKKHEDFIAAIRSAKAAQAHIKAGGNVRDLPPPPPSDYSDYTQCPHCGRKFNHQAAERHIPKCADFQHNKPKPSMRRKK